MTERDDPDQRQAWLLWEYIEQLKQAESPEDTQSVAVTTGEGAEVGGLMETASKVYAVARADSAPSCRREAVRRRLQRSLGSAGPETVASGLLSTQPAGPPARSAGRRVSLPAGRTARSAGWAAAIAVVALLLWIAVPRPRSVGPIDHQQAIAAMPALLAGSLDPAHAQAVWEHLSHCKMCFEIYKAKWQQADPNRHLDRQSWLPFGPSMLPVAPGPAPWRHVAGTGDACEAMPLVLDRKASFVP